CGHRWRVDWATAARATSSSLVRPCTARPDCAPHETSRVRPNQQLSERRARTRTNPWPSCCSLVRASRTQIGLSRNQREARPPRATRGENASLSLRPSRVHGVGEATVCQDRRGNPRLPYNLVASHLESRTRLGLALRLHRRLERVVTISRSWHSGWHPLHLLINTPQRSLFEPHHP